jgi:hypothetical protein
MDGASACGNLPLFSPDGSYKAAECCERQRDVAAVEQCYWSLEAVQSEIAKCASIENVGGGLESMEKSLKELEPPCKNTTAGNSSSDIFMGHRKQLQFRFFRENRN